MNRLYPLNPVVALFYWCVSVYFTWPHAVRAESFSSDIIGYDIGSLVWAVIMSLLGGALRTIFTLATDDKVVLSFGRETAKDAIVAMIAGGLAYITMEALRSFKFLPLTSEIRFAVIVFAGWSRMSFFGWLNKLGTRVTDTVNDKVVNSINGLGSIVGGTKKEELPNPDVPPSPKPPPFKETMK